MLTYYPNPKKIFVKGDREFSDREKKEIAACWKGGVDGAVIAVAEYSAEILLCELVAYSAVYAFLHGGKIDVQPLCVSGRVICEGSFLVGKRSKQVSTYAGCWELCPSGIIDQSSLLPDGSVDINHAVLKELYEETGIRSVQAVRPIGIYREKIWDICLDIYVQKGTTFSSGEEYDLVQWMNPHAKIEGAWVPLSEELLKLPI